jgi:hypothetical protein
LEESALKYTDSAAVTLSWFAKTPPAQTTIPNHKELDRGTLRAIIRQTGLTVEEFVALL